MADSGPLREIRAQLKTRMEKAVEDFLRHLRERNASPHTIKAYSGDLANFAAYAGSRGWKQIDHIAIRGFLSHLYEKGLGKTSVARALPRRISDTALIITSQAARPYVSLASLKLSMSSVSNAPARE